MRANNEGSIYQRQDGRWVASVTELKDGRRKRITYYAATEGEARRILTNLKQRQDAHVPICFDRQTVGQWLEFWLDTFIRPHRKPRTWASYHNTIQNYVLPAIGNEPLVGVAPELIQELINYHHGRGRQRTAEYIRSILRTAFKRAVKFKRMPWNPIDALDAVTVKKKQKTGVYTVEQVNTLLQAAAGHRLEAAFWLGVGLGMRKGELIGLDLEDVNLEQGTLRVRQTLQRIKLPHEEKRRIIEGAPKSEASRRDLPLPVDIVKALEKHLARRREDRLLAGSAWQETSHVFTTTTGTALDDDKLNKIFRALQLKAGLPLIRFHDLRHTCGSFLHARGASPFTIQEILGHSQLATTRRYTHIDQTVRKAALDQVSNLFGPKQPLLPAATIGSSDPDRSAVKPAVKSRLLRVK
jgi:integrase